MRHSFFRCTTIFILILSLGVGTAWANTTHPVYCAISPSSLGETGELYLNVHKGTTFDGGDWYRVKMDKIATTIHHAERHETKDLYVASIEYVEVGLQQMEFQIYDAAPPAPPRETHMAFDAWTTNSNTWTKQVFDYENNNFTTYPASLTQKKSYVYFDAADWNDDVKQLVISHGTYRGFNDLNHLSNTTLYYANPELKWGDAVCISFIGNSTSWLETGKWLNDIPLWSHHYTGYLHYSLKENSFNYFARRSGDEKGAALSYNYWGTESTAYQNLNKTQTVQARVKTTGSSYSDVSFASWPGSVSAKRTYMSSATATTSPSTANMTSATTDAVLTSSITLTASANSGYYFEGWGDASDSNPTDGTTAKTYSVTDTKTSYAFFSQTYTLTYDRKGDYSTSTLSVYSVDNFSGTTTSGSSIPTGHLIILVATPATGYEVEGWYSDAACTSPYTNGSGGVTIEGNTFKLASLNANTEVYCKFRPITYIVTLEGMEADSNDSILVNVTYDAVLPPLETKHTKAHYKFLGYWADKDDKGATLDEQLIDSTGAWKKDVSPYTGSDADGNPTWIYPNGKSLFAKWEEIKYTVNVAVYPAEVGSVQVEGVPISKIENVGYATHSPELTAVPSNAAWVFKEWQVSDDTKLHLDLENYSKFKETMEITATDANQGLTAVFEMRYNLVGSKYELDKDKDEMETGGMPGFTFGSGADFTINSYTANGDDADVDLSYTCTLDSGTYIFEIHDRKKGESLGRKDGTSIYVLNDGDSVELRGGEEGQDQSIFFYPKHEGQYTFRITYMRKEGEYYYPTVTVERPHAVYFGTGYAGIDDLSSVTSGTAGGTLEVTTSSGALANKDYVTYGTNVTYTPSPETGYTFEGFYTSNEFTYRFTQNNPWIHYNLTGDDYVYAKFVEKATTVTLSNDGHGHVEINDETVASTTVGVTTTRELTAVPNEGYTFSGWTLPENADFEVIEGDVDNPTITLRGKGAGDEGEIIANFTAREYTVTLEGMEPTTAGQGSVMVTFDASTNMTSAVTKPTKTNYTFDGYWTDNDDEGATLVTQLIDANGYWKKDISTYTGHDGSDNPTWIYPNDKSLFAKWNEDLHTVNVAVSPVGAGSVQISSSDISKVENIGIATKSDEMTAVPANAAWVFKEWQISSNDVHLDLETYTTTGTTMKINATANGQTLTAVFEPRYGLIGSLNEEGDPAGGMPNKNGETWGVERSADYEADFEVIGFTALGTGDGTGVDLQCTRTLLANKQYKFQVVDRSTIGRDRFCLEENGSAVLEPGNSVTLTYKEKGNANVLINAEGEGDYTFKITNISNDGNYYPTLTVIRPQQVNFGQKYQDIDGALHEGTTGGSVVVAKTAGGALTTGDWVTYNTSVTHTATATSPGYTFAGWWNSDAFTDDNYSTTNPMTYLVIERDNAYAQFTEIPTTVTLSNDGHGHVEINDETVSSTTVGITTHRELTAVPDEGYKFDSWTKISGDDITLSSTSENPTTLFGLGAGAVSGQEVRANFDYRWTLKAESDGWGQAEFIIKNISTNASGDVVGYVDISLSANTNYQFTMYDKQESQTYKNGSDQVYYMTNGNSHNWSFATDKKYNCGITTAGAGTYRFIWNITDKKMTVTYPNFVIYRTGDKADDPRAQNTDVDSYDGGTISQAIEFRMRVNRLDYWYTLCLPFTVSAVKVWDEEDGQYYDIVPYWRTEGKYYTGHYILRRPVTTTNFAIEGFEGKDRWIDPKSSDVLPSKNIPYIIQWHDEYFQGKYISFFGRAGESIPTSMNQGANTSSDETVNIYGNNSMTTSTVRDAYLLDPYYGTDGAWMREEIGTYRSVLPFECFILANEKTTAKYRVLRRDMADDTPTGLDTLSKTEDTVSKVLINNRIYIIRGGKMYTIQGTFVKEVE